MEKVLYTIGHSRHDPETFLKLLERFGIRVLADVRRWPGSRKFPHFRKEALREWLSRSGITYLHLPGLGGWRRPRSDSPNTGLENPGFRGYADHMHTVEFRADLERLLEIAHRESTTVMCAEGFPWRCHRWFLADALLLKGFRVLHILPEGAVREHRLHPRAHSQGGIPVYR